MRSFDIYVKSGTLFLCAGAATLAPNRALTSHIPDATLRLAAALSIVQVIAAIAMAVYLLANRYRAQFHKSICDQLRPAIQEHVTALAFTGQAWPTAVPKRGLGRRVLEECVTISLLGLKDSGRSRLTDFVWQQGFAKQWQQAFSSRSVNERKRAIALLGLVSRADSNALMHRALNDNEPAIRTEAARALLASGDPDSVDLVFRLVLGESLLLRVLLTADLKRHARSLLTNTIPAVLAESSNSNMLHCLQILTVWKLAIPGFDIAPLLNQHRDPLILPLVAALLPYVPVGDTVDDHLLSALAMPDLDVQCAAARAVGQLKLRTLIPSLLPLLNQNGRLAIAAATALAQMGMEGERQLQSVVAGSDRRASAAAMEALETLAVGVS